MKEESKKHSKSDEIKKQSEEYLNNWKKAEADLVNYKKNEAERMSEVVKYERESMILNVLQILDNIYLAEKHIPEDLKKNNWIEGFYHIKKQLEDLLKREGVKEVNMTNDGFDPATMEIIEEVEGDESGKVAEEVQKGYIMDGKVIRPAKVKVTK